MSWENDLKEGEEFERHVQDFFAVRFGIQLDKWPLKWCDLISTAVSVEVKYDRMMRRTQNAFFETSYDWTRSGALKWNFNVFAYGDREWFLIFQVQDLYRMLSDFPERTMKGDGSKSRWLLVPISRILPYCVKSDTVW